jgi:hypothetical protein
MAPDVPAPFHDVQRHLARAAAVLLLLGFLTGGLAPQAMTGKIDADARVLLVSHTNALLGGLLLLGLGWTLPFVRANKRTLVRISALFAVSNYANWLLTGIKAFLHVSGVDHTGQARNDVMFGLLAALVVVPSFAASIEWLIGLFRQVATGSGEGR